MSNAPYSDTLVDRLACAECVVVSTGAGISAESGIATFRDPGGIWTQFKPEELSNVDAFLRNPNLVQRWFVERRRIADNAAPNAGHRALVELEAMVSEFTVITQNVDDLHCRAGSKNIIELHGNLTRNYCIDCKEPADIVDEVSEDTLVTCATCSGLIRPDVVWFGEMLPEKAIVDAFALMVNVDVMLVVGTSGIVRPAADLPLSARSNGAYVAEINLEVSEIGHLLDETVLGPSGTVLPSLVEAVRTAKEALIE